MCRETPPCVMFLLFDRERFFSGMDKRLAVLLLTIAHTYIPQKCLIVCSVLSFTRRKREDESVLDKKTLEQSVLSAKEE